jgi:hypothetical protein
MTTEEFEANLTQAKNVLIEYLVDSNYIKSEDAEYLLLNTAILLKKPIFFSSLWKTYFKKEDINTLHYVIVEQKSLKKSKNNVANLKPNEE